jgi:NAD-dependent DNA ligase
MSRAPFDNQASQIIAQDVNAIVPWFLMASFLYYIEDESLLTDAYYDELSQQMLERWDEITHRHKQLISADDLLCGSGFAIREDEYPSITKYAARRLMSGAAL